MQSQDTISDDQNTRAADSVQDAIRVRNLSLTASFTDGAQWPSSAPGKAKLQPIYVTISLSHPIAAAAVSDNLEHSINYSTVSNLAIEACQSRSFSCTEDLVDELHLRCAAAFPGVPEFMLTVARPKGLLQPATVELTSVRTRGSSYARETLAILGMECNPIIGINDCERVQKQLVRFNLHIQRTFPTGKRERNFPFRELFLQILNAVDASSYLTLEALVSHVADIVLSMSGSVNSVTIRGGKPNAIACAEAAEVEITRTATARNALQPQVSQNASDVASGPHQVAAALGSNLGDRFANIETALRLIEHPADIYPEAGEEAYATVVDTSFMYETEPMYVTDQPKFINCACLIETNMAPLQVLKLFKAIETAVGRVASIRNGPRVIDLDVLTYDELVIDTRAPSERDTLDNLAGQLVVPHPRIVEREFVLRPLNDLIPNYTHPTLGLSIRQLFTILMAAQPAGTPPMYKVTPFPSYPDDTSKHTVFPYIMPIPTTATYWKFSANGTPSSRDFSWKTYVMATLNATPDSFSDGSDHNTVSTALTYAISSVHHSADIIDIGGYSTRPGAKPVSTEEEIQRVVPIVKQIRALAGSGSTADTEPALAERTSRALISVDTFRWEVAEAAIRAGANCINDVYAFTGPAYPAPLEGNEYFEPMRRIARDYAVPVVLMHSRGEASTNKDYSVYSYAADASGRGAVLEGVKVELGEKVERIVKGKGGLRRWMVILDPGIGFSKSLEGNAELLRGWSSLTRPGPSSSLNPLAGFPMLIGASRKSFLGLILAKADADGTYKGRETKPKEREWATAAAVASAVQQGAAVIRVHDVEAMGDVIRAASAIWS